jgi:hypothetical protein
MSEFLGFGLREYCSLVVINWIWIDNPPPSEKKKSLKEIMLIALIISF